MSHGNEAVATIRVPSRDVLTGVLPNGEQRSLAGAIALGWGWDSPSVRVRRRLGFAFGAAVQTAGMRVRADAACVSDAGGVKLSARA